MSLDRIAPEYVKLVLALGEHEPEYVDAYYGPAAWRDEVRAAPPPLADIAARADALAAEVRAAHGGDDVRAAFLATQLAALAARARMVGGARLSFDEESRALYDAVAPIVSDDGFRATLAALDAELPGPAPLPARVEAYLRRFEIPADRLERVLAVAVDACRARTRRRLELPAEESLAVELVTGKSWSGYNWYQGGYRSLVQINTDLPVTVDRVVELAGHEGYPGHHVANVLLEEHAVNERGWVELSVAPLYCPFALVLEGAANFGVALAFPSEERLRLERDTLFPLAGLDPGEAVAYARVRARLRELRYAANEAARRRLDGGEDAERVAAFLTDVGGMPPARAAQRVRFIDECRAYVINYNLGEDLVAAHVARAAGDDEAARWRAFADLFVWPRTASALLS